MPHRVSHQARLAGLVALLSLTMAPACLAQRSPEYHWLTAGVSATTFSMQVGARPRDNRYGFGAHIGVRICVCLDGRGPLSVTPGLSFNATDVRGLDSLSDTYAFSRLDGNVRIAYRIAQLPLRPYVSVRAVSVRSSELREPAPAGVTNYSGNVADDRVAYGVEFPHFPGGGGLDVSVTPVKGRFTRSGKQELAPASHVPYHGYMVSLGWTGKFTGSSLPWR